MARSRITDPSPGRRRSRSRGSRHPRSGPRFATSPSRGLRWTPQRRLLLDVLEETEGHVTGQRARRALPGARPGHHARRRSIGRSTSSRSSATSSHGHSAAGREEFHVLPETEHAHLQCRHAAGRGSSTPAMPRPSFARPAPIRLRCRPRPSHDLRGMCRLHCRCQPQNRLVTPVDAQQNARLTG